MLRKLPLLLLAAVLVLAGCSGAKPDANTASQEQAKPKKKKGGIQAFADVITDEAVADSGLFNLYTNKDQLFFEIPNDLLDREILLVSRMAGTVQNLTFGGAGQKARGQQVIRWQRHNDKVILRHVSFSSVASEDKPIYESVRNNNFEPVIATFDIKALSEDSSGVILDVTSLFITDVQLIGGLNGGQRRNFSVRRLDKGRSFISGSASYPENIEVRHVLTYDAGSPPDNFATGTISLEMNQSMILLPENPMQPRLLDERVGFFSVSQYDYGREAQKADFRQYITRWRLEPSDPEAFARGELVDPVKPIVYYIDSATPRKWVPYLIAGVEDWNAAFEEAGFKNAISARLAPTAEEDPEFSPEDVRYSVIRYVTNPIQNAQGPHVHDPRSGEILESDILWYHNVMNLLRNWYFVQTAAVDSAARGTEFSDELMGQLIQFVSSHEVGHTLGLPHNFIGSSSYPVDSLRSATFTQAMGTAPSIMDYARFNYIAQPGDVGVALWPNIGVYDKYAIRWGYRPITSANSADEEKSTLHSWIRAHETDPMYKFGRQTVGLKVDPRSQNEDLGDDAMKASEYGISNLKIIMNNLISWTAEDGKSYDDLGELYGQLLTQWNRYSGHVMANVGGVYENYRTYDQGAVYEAVAKEDQERAMAYLMEYTFTTPTWMINTDILRRIEHAGTVDRIRQYQVRQLNALLDPERMQRLIEAESLPDVEAYTLGELFEDVRAGVWTELRRGRTIDTYRRNLQRGYIDRMEYLMTGEVQLPPRSIYFWRTSVDMSQSDIRAFARAELITLRGAVNAAVRRTRDNTSKIHLRDVLVRIDDILDGDD